jgi:hypothetical protein
LKNNPLWESAGSIAWHCFSAAILNSVYPEGNAKVTSSSNPITATEPTLDNENLRTSGISTGHKYDFVFERHFRPS